MQRLGSTVVNQGHGSTLHIVLSEGSSVYQIVSHFRHFLTSEDGPAAVEYAVMLALILVACMNIVATLGQSLSSTFSTVNSSLAGS